MDGQTDRVIPIYPPPPPKTSFVGKGCKNNFSMKGMPIKVKKLCSRLTIFVIANRQTKWF